MTLGFDVETLRRHPRRRQVEPEMRIALWFVLVAWPCAGQAAEVPSPGVTTLVVAPGLSVDRERNELRIDAAMCLHHTL